MIVERDTSIYVICPAYSASGGPELLHQLVYSLRKNGLDAYMYYFPFVEDPVHSDYRFYENPFVRSIEDQHKNIVIVPEVKSFIDHLKNYSSVQKIIWWLSVDNHYVEYFENKFMRRIIRRFPMISRSFRKQEHEERVRELSTRVDLLRVDQVARASCHFVQSYYAYQHLLEKGIDEDKIFHLSDYINESFLSIDLVETMKRKKDLVIYNPNKGYKHTMKIIKALPDLDFKPLQNMSRDEVIDTMLSSKVYIDFGNHPGKDRMPREATLCGNCVITGMKGSAGNNVDVPIPEKYKFADTDEDIPEVCRTITSCLLDYDIKINDFASYREQIRGERKAFEDDVRSIFLR